MSDDVTVWVLRPRDDRLGKGERDTDPWSPWYDKCFGMVIRAATEVEAREVAQDESESETASGRKEVWTNPKLATCAPIEEYDPNRDGKYSTPDCVLMKDVSHA